MTGFASLLQLGAGQAWLFLPTALMLGALHALEPGHAKTMMASFIVATRGGGREAALLGLSAALSHSLVVWVLAAVALTYGDALIADSAEPYILLVSGILVMGIAAWMLRRIAREASARQHHARDHSHSRDGAHHHDHDRGDEEDAHARAHASQIERRFTGRAAGPGQIVLFGLTGGLMPCPAAVTVLLVCLNVKQITLGAGMVAAFSAGLALTLVGVGLAAAWGARHAERRLGKVGDAWLGRLPYLSMLLMAALGAVMAAMGAARI